MIQNIFVHFLNRELYRSLGIQRLPNANQMLKTVVLACGESACVPLSSLWESYNQHTVDYEFIKLIYTRGLLEVVSDCVTIDEFLEKKLQMYSFDRSRYRNIYFRPIKRIEWLKPTKFRQSGATAAISNEISAWEENAERKILLPESDLSVLNANKPQIIKTNQYRENSALTISLFSGKLLSQNDSFAVARFLSAYYILDYCHWLDADIISGLPGNLRYYDYLAQEYPYHDFRVLSCVLSLAGVTSSMIDQIKYNMWEIILNSGVHKSNLALIKRIIQHAVQGKLLVTSEKNVSAKDVCQYLSLIKNGYCIHEIKKMKSLSDLEYFGENLQLLESKIVPTSTQGIVLPFQKQHIEYEGVANMNFSKPKLFISHSTNDSGYVTLIVRLLEGIGVHDIFCSSIPGYGIPLKKDIYEYLRDQFQDHELYVLFVLSDHYYKSVASLNEMGAAWVLQKESLCILLPGFEFNEIQGAVNPREICIKLDDNEMTVLEYLNQWKASLESYFGLTPIQQARWERLRKEFLDGVLKLGADRSDAEKSE